MTRIATPVVYLAGPMSGISYNTATKWRAGVRNVLLGHGIECLSPMRDKDHLVDTAAMHHEAVGDPLFTSSGCVERDFQDIVRSDLVLINYLEYDHSRLSRGTIWETGVTFALRKSCVVVIQPNGNPHDDIFLQASAKFRYSSIPPAIEAIVSILLPG